MATEPRTFVIAEAGVNHNGDVALGRRLIDAAADAGADAVKFQTFQSHLVVSATAPKADYQQRTTASAESQLDMIRRLELSEAEHDALVAHANDRNITFLSTPFDVPSLRMLTERFGIATIKIPSGEITNLPFLLEIARRADRVILSTGMATIDEVQVALGVLAFGFSAPAGSDPSDEAFARAFSEAEGRGMLARRVSILHCTTEYPAPVAEVNLRAMDTMKATFGLPVGYSDHTDGIHISLAAVARGATIIEKHLTLDRSLPGPDHRASIEPDDFRRLVDGIRDIERALGDGVKRPGPSERKNRDVARRSLVAARDIAAGEVFTEENLTCKRPGTGVPASAWYRTLARRASRAYRPDELIDT